MSQTEAGQSTDEEPLKVIFDQAMKLFDNIENGNEATNSDPVQMSIKAAISKFEKATNMVSFSGMFSRNESLEELPTETLQYLLLPALLGTLSLKLCNQARSDIINVAEIYFRDFLQRCKDYGVTDVELPHATDRDMSDDRPQSEQAKIVSLVLTRDAKIKRYKEMKEIKEKLSTLSKAMSSDADDETKREYFTTLLQSYVHQALEELSSIEQERPILEYMAKHAGELKPKERPRAPPLKPIIITRDAVQKAVYGLGYPAIPTMTIEEFYDNRVKEGLFPAGCADNIPHATIEHSEDQDDEQEQIEKERLVEEDDPEELARQRNMDEYKDDHRRGWGNRHNRS